MMKKLLAFVIIFFFILMSTVSSSRNNIEYVNNYTFIPDAVDSSKKLSACDHQAYLSIDTSGCWLYEFTLSDPNNLMCTCAGENVSIVNPSTWSNNKTILAYKYNTGLVEINPETCEIEIIGGGGDFNDIAMDPTTGKLYGASSNGFHSGLWLINLETGEQEYIGDFVSSSWIDGLAFDADGILYGWDFSSDYLYTISTSTGDATPVGPLGINIGISDGGFCMEDDILYLAAFTSSPQYGSYLYECDEDAGQCTLIDEFEGGAIATMLAIPYESQSQYTPHDPIYINGNDDFTIENGVTGGSGTSNDPYIIKDWEINATSQYGVTIRNTSVYFTIMNCYIHDGGINNDGIVFINVTNGTIEETKITENRNGIMFRTQYMYKENSENNIIRNNYIISNTNDGINFEHTGGGYHSNNVITKNNISDNNRGVYMIMSAYNQIFSNNIISNDQVGIMLDMCDGGGQFNNIYHNNFVNNGVNQALERGGPINIWDDGYPSGGNYWSDYNGTDNNGDGICDTPYPIPDGDSKDRYPLMNPWGGLNLPPNKPSIDGPTKIKVGEDNEFTFSAIDPDRDNVSFNTKWGDGNETGWLNFVESGKEIKLKHNWSIQGVYKIQCIAKDVYEAYSDIEEFYIEVTKSKQFSINLRSYWFFNKFPLFQHLLSIFGRDII
jgi:parallel beta-helix repeat protein